MNENKNQPLAADRIVKGSTEIEILRSKRRTLALEIRPDGSILVRAPQRVSNRRISQFIEERSEWIEKHMARMERKRESEPYVERLTKEELRQLAKQAQQVIPGRVAYYGPKVGVTYGKITIRNQRTRWGSCSSKGNLNFNCLLMLAPPEVLDSVVVHELCHRIEMNHSDRFYAQVYRVFPEYDRWNRWLKENGNRLMRRMTG